MPYLPKKQRERERERENRESFRFPLFSVFVRALSSPRPEKTIHPRGRERRGRFAPPRDKLSLSLRFPLHHHHRAGVNRFARNSATTNAFYRNARSKKKKKQKKKTERQKLQTTTTTKCTVSAPECKNAFRASNRNRGLLLFRLDALVSSQYFFFLFFSRDDDDDDEKGLLSLTTTTPDDGDARIALLRYFIPFLPSSSNHNNLFRSARKTPSSNGRVMCRVSLYNNGVYKKRF